MRAKWIADYFLEDRNDLLISNFPVSGIIGTSAPGASNPTVNAGTTRNKGVELVLNFKDDLSDDFSYGISYNVTKVDGEVIEINGDVIPEGGNFSVGQLAPSRMEVGQPIGYFYGLQTNGIFQFQLVDPTKDSQVQSGCRCSRRRRGRCSTSPPCCRPTPRTGPAATARQQTNRPRGCCRG